MVSDTATGERITCGCGSTLVETGSDMLVGWWFECRQCGVTVSTREADTEAEAIAAFNLATRVRADELLRDVMVFLPLIDGRHHDSDRYDVAVLQDRITAYLEGKP